VDSLVLAVSAGLAIEFAAMGGVGWKVLSAQRSVWPLDGRDWTAWCPAVVRVELQESVASQITGIRNPNNDALPGRCHDSAHRACRNDRQVVGKFWWILPIHCLNEDHLVAIHEIVAH
jgi:hypothetical protein